MRIIAGVESCCCSSWVSCECEALKDKGPAKGKAAKGKGAKGKEAAAEPVPEKPAVWGQVANAVVYGVPSTFKLS